MDKKVTWILSLGIITTLFYIVFSSMIKTTEAIWILTRVFGLVSFLGFFLVVILGEIRLNHKVKGEFTLFRFHKPLAIFSTFIVFLHLISAIFDKYKWGVYLNFTNYLGFSFGDKWLVFLSLGTIAFYLFILIGASSANKSMQILGFKKWRVIHYGTYLAFIISYIHAINLGTDLKTSVFASILHPIIVVMFLLVISLFLLRIINSFKIFEDQLEINLTGVFIIIIILSSAFLISSTLEGQNELNALRQKLNVLESDISYHENVYNNLTVDVNAINNQLSVIQNG